MAIEDIQNVVIIGAGAMGSGIAQITAMAGYRVTIVDVKEEYIDRGMAIIKKNLKKLERKRKLKGTTAEILFQSIKHTTNLETAVKNADLCLEAVMENMEVKKRVFATLGEHAPNHCILTSNTSSMSISEIAEASGRPENVCGIHFFNPAALMRLVEIIKGVKSSESTLKNASDWANSLPCLRGKRYCPLVLKDRPGFIANRVQAPTTILINWALDYCRDHGIPFEYLDTDASNEMMPMGPLVLMDWTGLDINYHIQQYYAENLHPDFAPGKVLSEKVANNELGTKTQKGLFVWPDGNRPEVDRSHKANLISIDLLLAIQANEACRILEEGVVKDWLTIDKTMEAGFNAPGPVNILAYGDNKAKWVAMLDKAVEKTGKSYLTPCKLLRSGGFRKLRKKTE